MNKNIILRNIPLFFKWRLFGFFLTTSLFLQTALPVEPGVLPGGGGPGYKYQLFQLPIVLGTFAFRGIDLNNVEKSLVDPEPAGQNYILPQKGEDNEYEDLSGLAEALDELGSWSAKSMVDEILGNGSEQPILFMEGVGHYFKGAVIGLAGENGAEGTEASSAGESKSTSEGQGEAAGEEAMDASGPSCLTSEDACAKLIDGVKDNIITKMRGLGVIDSLCDGQANPFLASCPVKNERVTREGRRKIAVQCQCNGLTGLGKIIMKENEFNAIDGKAVLSVVLHSIIRSDKDREVANRSVLKVFEVISFFDGKVRSEISELVAEDILNERMSRVKLNDDCWFKIFSYLNSYTLNQCFMVCTQFRDLIKSSFALRKKADLLEEYEKWEDESGNAYPMSPIEGNLQPEERQLRVLRGIVFGLHKYRESKDFTKNLYTHCSLDASKKACRKKIEEIFRSHQFSFDHDFRLIFSVKVPELIDKVAVTQFSQVFFYSQDHFRMMSSNEVRTEKFNQALLLPHTVINISFNPYVFMALEAGALWSMDYLMERCLLVVSIDENVNDNGEAVKKALIEYLNVVLKANNNDQLQGDGTVKGGIFDARVYAVLSNVRIEGKHEKYVSNEARYVMDAERRLWQHQKEVKEFHDRKRKAREGEGEGEGEDD